MFAVCDSMVILSQIRELAEKESEDGVFKMLRSDVTRFLTTILIGTTYCSIPCYYNWFHSLEIEFVDYLLL